METTVKETIEVFWFSEQPYGYVTDEDLAKYPSGRLDFPVPFKFQLTVC
jgi:hypothetical protein